MSQEHNFDCVHADATTLSNGNYTPLLAFIEPI